MLSDGRPRPSNERHWILPSSNLFEYTCQPTHKALVLIVRRTPTSVE